MAVKPRAKPRFFPIPPLTCGSFIDGFINKKPNYNRLPPLYS